MTQAQYWFLVAVVCFAPNTTPALRLGIGTGALICGLASLILGLP